MAELMRRVILVFERVERHYGSQTATELETWTRRHWVGRTRAHLRYWYELFLRIAGLLNRRPRGDLRDLRLEPGRRHLLEEAIRERLGDEYHERLDRLEAEAEALPLSEVEDKALRLEPETLRPGDDPHFPAVVAASRVAREERVRELWDHLDSWLEPAERSELLRWGEQESVAAGDGPELAAYPAER